jgi:hypothetical protein
VSFGGTFHDWGTCMARHAIAAASLMCGLMYGFVGCAPAQYHDPCAVRPGEWSVAIDEIDAAGRLDFDPSRTQILRSVAARPGLTPAEQEHLVCVTLHRVDFDPSRQVVLRTLIQNPEFSPRAKAAILRNLELIDFDPARSQLLREMHGRGDDHVSEHP